MALDVVVVISTPMSSNAEAAQPNDPNELDAEVAHILKANRYEARSDTLTFTEAEAASFRTQQQKWREYFSAPDHNGGLTAGLIQNPAIWRDKRGELIPAKLIVVHSQTSDRRDPSGRRSAVWPPAVGAI